MQRLGGNIAGGKRRGVDGWAGTGGRWDAGGGANAVRWASVVSWRARSATMPAGIVRGDGVGAAPIASVP